MMLIYGRIFMCRLSTTYQKKLAKSAVVTLITFKKANPFNLEIEL